jgi:hypothetical protein
MIYPFRYGWIHEQEARYVAVTTLTNESQNGEDRVSMQGERLESPNDILFRARRMVHR